MRSYEAMIGYTHRAIWMQLRGRVLSVPVAALSCVCCGVLFLTGCETTVNTRYVNAPEPHTDQYVEVSARFLGEEMLEQRYGRNNPFVAPPRLFTKFEFQVYELYIDGVVAIEQQPIALRDITFVFGGEVLYPLSASELTAIWRREVEVHGRDSVQSGYSSTIRKALLPNSIGSSAVGLLVFKGSFPLEGHATLAVPHPRHFYATSGDNTATEATSEVDEVSPEGVSERRSESEKPETNRFIEMRFDYSFKSERRPFDLFRSLSTEQETTPEQ